MPMKSYQIILHAGPHDRRNCPIHFTLPDALPAGSWQLNDDNGNVRPLQRLTDRELALIEQELPAGTSRSYRIEPASAPSETLAIVQETESGILDLMLQGAVV